MVDWFVDIGYNSNEDHTGKLGMVVGPIDKQNIFTCVHCFPSKCERATHSTSGRKHYGFSNGYYFGITVRRLFYTTD